MSISTSIRHKYIVPILSVINIRAIRHKYICHVLSGIHLCLYSAHYNAVCLKAAVRLRLRYIASAFYSWLDFGGRRKHFRAVMFRILFRVASRKIWSAWFSWRLTLRDGRCYDIILRNAARRSKCNLTLRAFSQWRVLNIKNNHFRYVVHCLYLRFSFFYVF